MKRYFAVLLVIIASLTLASGQKPSDEAKIRTLLNEFLAGAGRNDAAMHDRFWAEDLIYTRSAGSRVGKAELMKGVRSAPAQKDGDPVTVYTSEDVRIQLYGNAAVVAFRLVGTTKRPDGTTRITNHLNTGTFIKRRGEWRVVAWQATTVPDPK